RRRHTRFSRDWSSDVCSSDLVDRVGDRLPDPDVVVRLARLVEREVPVVVRPHLPELEAVVPGERGDLLRRDVVGPVDLPGLERRSEERRVGEEGRKWGWLCDT